MNRIELSFPLKAISVNQYHRSTANGRRYISKKGKEFNIEFEKHLSHQSHKVNMFFMDIDHHKDWVEIEIRHFHKDLFRKHGGISSKCIDVDNPCKILIDNIFNFAGVDDKCLRSLKVEKLFDDKDHVEIIIQRTMPLMTYEMSELGSSDEFF